MKHIDSEFFLPQLEDLRAKYGKNKQYPMEFELPILITLSYFPEFIPLKIHFVRQKSELAFASRPSAAGLFLPPEKREYLIILSTQSSKVPKELLFEQLTLNRQVGILGHELSHTLFYLSRRGAVIISVGIQYLFSNYRVKFEKDTDRAAIRRGLGHQLFDFATYWREHPKTSDHLRNWHGKFYLHPQEILQEMKNIPDYKL